MCIRDRLKVIRAYFSYTVCLQYPLRIILNRIACWWVWCRLQCNFVAQLQGEVDIHARIGSLPTWIGVVNNWRRVAFDHQWTAAAVVRKIKRCSPFSYLQPHRVTFVCPWTDTETYNDSRAESHTGVDHRVDRWTCPPISWKKIVHDFAADAV